jgi:hypothetical protein
MSKPAPVIPRNPVYEKALALLAHPASLAALALLLLNDHLLRLLWPSWWTGKLGDVAWLFFAPFALAALLAWLIPARTRARERWVFALSFALVGGCFIILKTVPGLNTLATRIGLFFLHTPLSLTRDPSDLLALPALVGAVFLWRATPANPRFSPRTWVLLPLAALLTLANQGIPDPGIVCFGVANGVITAGTGYATFTTSDGGLTWAPGQVGTAFSCTRKFLTEGKDWFETPGLQPATLYRFRPGDTIQISNNSGQTWQVIQNLKAISEARQLYYIRSRQGYAVYQPGPHDAIADPVSGNILFAMGHQGVLLRTASGAWAWSPVAGYRPLEPFPTADAYGLLLGGMLYLAAGLLPLIFCTQALRWAGGPLRTSLTALAWVAWLIVDIFFPPAQATSYAQVVSLAGILGIFIFALPLAIEQGVRLFSRARGALLPLLGYGLLAGVLYMLPYLLWLFSTLPSLWLATLFGLCIVLAVFAASFAAARRIPAPRSRLTRRRTRPDAKTNH